MGLEGWWDCELVFVDEVVLFGFALRFRMTRGFTVIANGDRVVKQIFVPELVRLQVPLVCSSLIWHVPLALDNEPKSIVVCVACFKFILGYMLDHEGMVREQLKIIFGVEMEVGLGENTPCTGPTMERVDLGPLGFVVLVC